jgi:hypothetical protein
MASSEDGKDEAEGSASEASVFQPVLFKGVSGSLTLDGDGICFEPKGKGSRKAKVTTIPWSKVEKHTPSPPKHAKAMLKIIFFGGDSVVFQVITRDIIKELTNDVAKRLDTYQKRDSKPGGKEASGESEKENEEGSSDVDEDSPNKEAPETPRETDHKAAENEALSNHEEESSKKEEDNRISKEDEDDPENKSCDPEIAEMGGSTKSTSAPSEQQELKVAERKVDDPSENETTNQESSATITNNASVTDGEIPKNSSENSEKEGAESLQNSQKDGGVLESPEAGISGDKDNSSEKDAVATESSAGDILLETADSAEKEEEPLRVNGPTAVQASGSTEQGFSPAEPSEAGVGSLEKSGDVLEDSGEFIALDKANTTEKQEATPDTLEGESSAELNGDDEKRSADPGGDSSMEESSSVEKVGVSSVVSEAEASIEEPGETPAGYVAVENSEKSHADIKPREAPKEESDTAGDAENAEEKLKATAIAKEEASTEKVIISKNEEASAEQSEPSETAAELIVTEKVEIEQEPPKTAEVEIQEPSEAAKELASEGRNLVEEKPSDTSGGEMTMEIKTEEKPPQGNTSAEAELVDDTSVDNATSVESREGTSQQSTDTATSPTEKEKPPVKNDGILETENEPSESDAPDEVVAREEALAEKGSNLKDKEVLALTAESSEEGNALEEGGEYAWPEDDEEEETSNRSDDSIELLILQAKQPRLAPQGEYSAEDLDIVDEMPPDDYIPDDGPAGGKRCSLLGKEVENDEEPPEEDYDILLEHIIEDTNIEKVPEEEDITENSEDPRTCSLLGGDSPSVTSEDDFDAIFDGTARRGPVKKNNKAKEEKRHKLVRSDSTSDESDGGWSDEDEHDKKRTKRHNDSDRKAQLASDSEGDDSVGAILKKSRTRALAGPDEEITFFDDDNPDESMEDSPISLLEGASLTLALAQSREESAPGSQSSEETMSLTGMTAISSISSEGDGPESVSSSSEDRMYSDEEDDTSRSNSESSETASFADDADDYSDDDSSDQDKSSDEDSDDSVSSSDESGESDDEDSSSESSDDSGVMTEYHDPASAWLTGDIPEARVKNLKKYKTKPNGEPVERWHDATWKPTYGRWEEGIDIITHLEKTINTPFLDAAGSFAKIENIKEAKHALALVMESIRMGRGEFENYITYASDDDSDGSESEDESSSQEYSSEESSEEDYSSDDDSYYSSSEEEEDLDAVAIENAVVSKLKAEIADKDPEQAEQIVDYMLQHITDDALRAKIKARVKDPDGQYRGPDDLQEGELATSSKQAKHSGSPEEFYDWAKYAAASLEKASGKKSKKTLEAASAADPAARGKADIDWKKYAKEQEKKTEQTYAQPPPPPGDNAQAVVGAEEAEGEARGSKKKAPKSLSVLEAFLDIGPYRIEVVEKWTSRPVAEDQEACLFNWKGFARDRKFFNWKKYAKAQGNTTKKEKKIGSEEAAKERNYSNEAGGGEEKKSDEMPESTAKAEGKGSNVTGIDLLKKLISSPDDKTRAILLDQHIAPPTPDNTAPFVSPDDLLQAIAKFVEMIRKIKQSDNVPEITSARQVAIVARLAIIKIYGEGSEELRKFELGLAPAFAPGAG